MTTPNPAQAVLDAESELHRLRLAWEEAVAKEAAAFDAYMRASNAVFGDDEAQPQTGATVMSKEEISKDALISAMRPLVALMWEAFLEGGDLDAYDIHDAFNTSKLVDQRPATAEEAKDADYDEGDEILALNELGYAALGKIKP